VGVSGVSRRVEDAGGRVPLEVLDPRFAPRSVARFAMLLALCGRLAALVHVALVAHVTCGADGELVHVRAGRSPAPATRDGVGPAAGAARDEHDHCARARQQRLVLALALERLHHLRPALDVS
jgi:hypothetical protein